MPYNPSDDIEIFGTIRQNSSGSGWYVLNDSQHEPRNITGISTTNGSSTAGYVTITYPKGQKVGTLLIAPDETFAQTVALAGASVDVNQSSFRFSVNNSPVSPNSLFSPDGNFWIYGKMYGPVITDNFPGVVFNGTNASMTRGADLTGNSDGKKGIVSLWFKMNGGNGSGQVFLRSAGGTFAINRSSPNTIDVIGFNSVSQILGLTTTGTYIADSTWHHVMASWDLSSGACHLYVDGSNVLDASTKIAINDVIDYTRTNWSVGATDVPSARLNGDLSEVYFNSAEYIDLSNATNRAKFYNAGHPLSLGANGSVPTGSQPILYLKGPAASFSTNLGSGGNFTVTGSLTDSSTSP